MAAQYAIIRFKKYKGPEISPIEAHKAYNLERFAANCTCKSLSAVKM